MSDRQHPPLTQLPLDTLRTMSPRQVHEHIALIVGKSIAEYHKEFHTPWWKKIAKRLAAEVQSFKVAVNEDYGKQHERGELAWQRGAALIARAVSWPHRFLAWCASPFRAAANAEIVEDFEDSPEEGEATASKVKFTEGRAARR